MLVAGTSVPVVPCYLEGCFDAFPPDASYPRASAFTFTSGLRCCDQVENEREGWDAIAAQLEEGGAGAR